MTNDKPNQQQRDSESLAEAISENANAEFDATSQHIKQRELRKQEREQARADLGIADDDDRDADDFATAITGDLSATDLSSEDKPDLSDAELSDLDAGCLAEGIGGPNLDPEVDANSGDGEATDLSATDLSSEASKAYVAANREERAAAKEQGMSTMEFLREFYEVNAEEFASLSNLQAAVDKARENTNTDLSRGVGQ